MTRYSMDRVNRDYPISSGEEINVALSAAARLQRYQVYWNFYHGLHWDKAATAGEPTTTVNFAGMFVDKHAQYLFGREFTVHANFRGRAYDLAADLLNEEWEKNDIGALGFQLGQLGGVTGDCWINLGFERDPIFGEKIKYTAFPSEYVFPIFRRGSQRMYDALLVQWPETEVVSNTYGNLKVKAYTAGQYWTAERMWTLRNGQPVKDPEVNTLGEIPFVHIPNIQSGTEFWGQSDLARIVSLNRSYNEAVTSVGDIINYHAAPVTVIYGAKASALQKGARKVWSGLPKDARVENLQLTGDLSATRDHINDLKDTIMQLGQVPKAALGGSEAISNTSGVAIAMQFAPLLEHMTRRRLSYGGGLRKVNYLTLKMLEIMGKYQANGTPTPYYSGIKWPDPLPRDKQLRLNELQVMHQLGLLTRARILRELIHNDIAPSDLEDGDAATAVAEAMAEELKFVESMGVAQAKATPQTQAASAQASSLRAESAAKASAYVS